MTEIPDDVMKAAREAHAEFAKSSVRDNLTVIIARAIMAERERCARIAISQAPATQDFSDSPLQELANRVAAKIRNN